MKGDLLGLMRERAAEPFTEAWIRNVVFQVLQVRRGGKFKFSCAAGNSYIFSIH